MHAEVERKCATVTNKSAYNYRNDFGRKIVATHNKEIKRFESKEEEAVTLLAAASATSDPVHRYMLPPASQVFKGGSTFARL